MRTIVCWEVDVMATLRCQVCQPTWKIARAGRTSTLSFTAHLSHSTHGME